jgi:hypothetical protein
MERSAMLADKAILIVEDNVLLAYDLLSVVESNHGQIIGPVMTAREAMHCLESEEIAGVILDAELVDKEIEPVLMMLAEKRIPLVMHAAIEPPPLARTLLPNAPILKAPIQTEAAVARLAIEIARQSNLSHPLIP